MNRELCRYCRKPMATAQDCDVIPPGEGEHLCWQILQGCDQDQEDAIDLRDAEIERLDRELAEWQDKLDGSEMAHAATMADLRDCHAALATERALADSLAGELRWRVEAGGYGSEQGKQALAAWREARRA